MADGEAPALDTRGSIAGKKTLTYQTWTGMRRRCYDKRHKTYPDYGGRGVRVFFDWIGPGGFAQFVRDVGLRPGRDYQLDRKDPNKGYEPGNVRWIPRAVNLGQVRREDHRGNKITAVGPDGLEHTQTLQQWAKDLGLQYRSLSRRLQRARTPEQRALVFARRKV